MKRRCYNCKCLQEESTIQYNVRIKNNPLQKFFCRKCKPYQNIETIKPIIDNVKSVKKRKSYTRLLKIPKSTFIYSGLENNSIENECHVGCFFRKKPKGCEISFLIPIEKGGKRKLENMKYSSNDENLHKTAKELTKKIKNEILRMYPPTNICEGIQEKQFTYEKRIRVSKYKRIRKLKIIKK